MSESPEQIQRRYYTATAAMYDGMHTRDDQDEHFVALKFLEMLSAGYGFESFLDVGAGTGRAVRFLRDKGHTVRGVEPVKALIEVARAGGIPDGIIVEGTGNHLPFEDSSFDVVLECGVLHHVKDPSRVVSEMMRVARKAVFLSDANRFGQGPHSLRLLKLFLYKLYLWDAARYLQTGGKMYVVSEGDGLAYSYSVFDSYELLANWAQSIVLFPTKVDVSVKSWLHPLLTTPHVLLCALKEKEG
jgi:ubiquinone/menaquinone biosynthesis C-methylase UbiE